MNDDAPRGRSKRANRDPAFEAVFGARIQAARVAAKMSQAALGQAVGVSWQQMQKYERGKDRVSVSTLAAIATALSVHPGSFFTDDGLAPSTRAAPGSRGTLVGLRSAQRIGERIERLHDPDVVRRLMALIDAMVNAQNGTAPDGAAEWNRHGRGDVDP